MDYTTRILSHPPTNPHSAVLTDTDVPDRDISWAEYATASKRIAVGLKALGLVEKDCVGLLSRNDIYYYVLGDSVIAAGGIFTGIPPVVDSAKLATYMTVAKIKWLVVAPEFLELARSTAANVGLDESNVLVFDPPGLELSEVHDQQPRFSSLLSADESLWKNPNAGQDPKALIALRLFTSGTTGSIKAAELSHAALVTRLDAKDFVPSPQDRCQLQYISLSSTGGQIICQRAFAGWLPACITNHGDELSILDRVQAYGISVVQMPPRTMEIITDLVRAGTRPAKALESLNTILVGGASSRKEGVDEFAAILPKKVLLRSGFGSTEAGIIAMTPDDPDQPWRPGPGYVGPLAPDVELRIIDPETLEPISSDCEGEICVRSGQNFSGYCNNPAATAEALLPDVAGGAPWFRTGDRGYLDPQVGQLALTGRFNEMFTAKLERVVPSEVEAELMKHDAIEDAAVTSTQARDIKGDYECIAYIVRRNGSTLSARQVVDFIAGRLSKGKAPTGGVIFCDSVPRNISRKIMRHQLSGLDALPGSERYLVV